MPVWAWLFFVLMIGYNTFVLWRAWRQKQFKYGPIIYALDEGPIYFWFFAFVFTLTEIFLLVFFGLSVVSTIWGPVFHQ
jgi:hypothetical protein